VSSVRLTRTPRPPPPSLPHDIRSGREAPTKEWESRAGVILHGTAFRDPEEQFGPALRNRHPRRLKRVLLPEALLSSPLISEFVRWCRTILARARPSSYWPGLLFARLVVRGSFACREAFSTAPSKRPFPKVFPPGERSRLYARRSPSPPGLTTVDGAWARRIPTFHRLREGTADVHPPA
jgi:hypothetical protein